MDHSSSNSLSFSSPLVVVTCFVFAIGLIIGGVVGVLYHSGIDEVRSSLAGVRGEVNRMRSETDGLQKKVNGFQVTVESGKKEIDEKLTAESQRVGKLASKVDGLDGQQVALKTKVESLDGQQVALKAEVKTIGTAQTAIKAENKKFAGQLAAEIRRINSLNTKVQGVERAAASTAAETKRLASDGAAIRTDLKSLQSEFGHTDDSFDRLVGAIAGLGTAGKSASN